MQCFSLQRGDAPKRAMEDASLVTLWVRNITLQYNRGALLSHHLIPILSSSSPSKEGLGFSYPFHFTEPQY